MDLKIKFGTIGLIWLILTVKWLIIQGCAGTGKSQVVKIVTRLVRRIFNCNRAVLNVAPTSAAGLLLPDGGTIHSCVNIPRKRKEKITLADRPMSADQSDHLKRLTLDDDDSKHLSLSCVLMQMKEEWLDNTF